MSVSSFSYVPYSLTLKMQAIGSTATELNFFWTTRHHIPEANNITLESGWQEGLFCKLLRAVGQSPSSNFFGNKSY
jgi:hypothetical protein